ncbi:FGGY-family carbohydrate kinase [Deinococcus apachensis]|uniref:FGGY-family carbohydrate kinase n=1 Tax=Deinococcus apachensis TaxID=309886 RepID=UPI000375AD21|nr:FGGY-family carbohydrate kinase [Deinococcus apachensis]
MSTLLLGIDIGTYSSKGVLATPDGELLRTHVVPHGLDLPHPGWAEQDPDGVWWHDVIAICRALLDGEPYTGADVAALAVSAIGPCLVPLDAGGRPLRPGILYGIDTRATEEIQLLEDRYGAERIFRDAGMNLSSQAVGPKILWMQRHEPDLWARTARVTTASSYVTFRLTGEHVMDRHTASYFIPLFDARTQEWTDAFGFLDLGMLPRLGWSDELAGTVTPEAAMQTGLRAGTPVAVGAVDALSEAISVGAVESGDLMLMYGTTAFFILVGQELTPHPSLWNVSGAYDGQRNIAAGMATTGALTQWLRTTLLPEVSEEEAFARLFEEAAAVPAGSDGLLLLPYFSGERTPIQDPQARGVLAGLNLTHTRGHLFRAALEGIGLGIRHNLEAFRELGAPIQRIVAVGGGTRSREWLQIVSDITGVPQLLPTVTIGASYGDAFLAGLVGGAVRRDDIQRWNPPRETIAPNPGVRPIYDARFGEYRALYDQTRDIVHHLAGAAGR